MRTDKAMIYVAGNPDNYPVEYYDAESETFCGAIPSFLEEFSEEYGYDLRYLQPEADDNREKFAENEQVDVISGCDGDEHYRNISGEPVVLFRYYKSGEETQSVIFFTSVAPESFKEDLREYASSWSESTWTGEVIASAKTPIVQQLPAGAAAGIWAVFICLVLIILTMAHRHYRSRKIRIQESLTDPKTGLSTQEAAKQAYIKISKDQSRRFYYMIYFQLDLTHIGYMWGAETADRMLEHAAGVLKQEAVSSEIISRAYDGGLVVLRRFIGDDEAESWAERIIAKIRKFMPDSEYFELYNISAGIYPLKTEFRDFEQAFFHIRQCAFVARDEKKEIRMSRPDMCRQCRERWKLLADFENGIKRDEFKIYIQFFVEAKTHRIVGGEALSRWEHRQMGLLNPNRYIPLLETDGRIGTLDLYILEKTCVLLEKLDGLGIRDFFISCNFARKTFSSADFADKCIEIIGKYSFERRLLICEVTESQLIDSREAGVMLANIVKIRDYGVRVIFDDFGMGFSSYHDLQEYPMDGLKLDKELIDSMDTEQGRIIISALVDTGHRMGLTILAEGVEEDSQIEILTKLDCDVFQGFRFYVPLPEEEAYRRILEKRN